MPTVDIQVLTITIRTQFHIGKVRVTVDDGVPVVFDAPGTLDNLGEVEVPEGGELLLEALDSDLDQFCASGSNWNYDFPWQPTDVTTVASCSQGINAVRVVVTEAEMGGTTGAAWFNPAD